MLRTIILTLAILNAWPAITQKLQIVNQNRDLRAGFENSLEFTLDKKYDSVNLKVSQGTVALEDKMVIRLIPEVSGKDTLFLSFFNKGNRIYSDTAIFDIIKPEVFPAYGPSLIDRKFTSKFLKTIGGVQFYIRVNDYHWESVKIESYRFSIMRKGYSLYSTIQHSNKFSSDIIEKLELLSSGDIILITDAKIDTQYYKHVNILPGIFEIE